MLKKFLLSSIAILILTGWMFAGTAAYVNEDIEIGKAEICKNNVISVGGDVVIEGEVSESVNVIGGTLKLKGTVKKDVVCILTDIELEDTAVIEGDFIAIGGKINRSCKASIKGGIFTSKLMDYDKVENSLIPVLFESGNEVVKVTKIVFWFILGLILFAVFPKKVYEAVDLASKKPVRIFTTGLLSIVAMAVLGILFAVMSFILIGIPFLIGLIVICFTILLIGRTVVFHIAGEKILGLFKIDYKKLNPVYLIFIGAMLYLGVKFIPVAGFFVIIVVNILEFGIGMRYLLRKRLKSV